MYVPPAVPPPAAPRLMRRANRSFWQSQNSVSTFGAERCYEFQCSFAVSYIRLSPRFTRA